MAIDLGKEPPLEVGGATIDPISREAKYAGGLERLQPQTLKVLIALTRRRNQVVTRAELVESCWDAKFVGDDVINRSISTLRQFAQRASSFTIETVPRVIEVSRAYPSCRAIRSLPLAFTQRAARPPYSSTRRAT